METRFTVEGGVEPVPAVVWRPEGEGPWPLALTGHGGGGHKADAFVTAVRDRLVERGIAVAAIDAVGHGERAPAGAGPEQIVADLAKVETFETMVTDWIATLDALMDSGDFRADAVGYIGLSGGTVWGLPFVAADERVAAAALGAAGYEGAPLLGDAPTVFGPVLRRAAAAFRRPALFHLQEDDDFFPPSGGRALFEDLASADKTLTSAPGGHVDVPVGALDRMCGWLAERLQG